MRYLLILSAIFVATLFLLQQLPSVDSLLIQMPVGGGYLKTSLGKEGWVVETPLGTFESSYLLGGSIYEFLYANLRVKELFAGIVASISLLSPIIRIITSGWAPSTVNFEEDLYFPFSVRGVIAATTLSFFTLKILIGIKLLSFAMWIGVGLYPLLTLSQLPYSIYYRRDSGSFSSAAIDALSLALLIAVWEGKPVAYPLLFISLVQAFLYVGRFLAVVSRYNRVAKIYDDRTLSEQIGELLSIVWSLIAFILVVHLFVMPYLTDIRSESVIFVLYLLFAHLVLFLVIIHGSIGEEKGGRLFLLSIL